MKLNRLFQSIVFTTLLLAGCQQSNSKQNENNEDVKVASIENEDLIENQISAIENSEELSIINSLAYNNNDGSRIEVVAYLDKNDNEVKIEETFADVKSGDYGKFTYYIDKGKKFATKDVYFDNQIKSPSFIERITYYDSNSKPIFTKERKALYEEDLEKEAFQIATPKDRSIDKAMRVLNQEKEFETTFQGFASASNLDYLLVGENSKDGYASSLAVQYKEGDIQKLMNNEKKMIGTPLIVQHEVMVDERGLKFQVLLSVKIK